MFGDIGHGTLLFLFASSLCFCGGYIKKSFPSLESFYKARYLLLLMAIFTIFCGLVYNDCMSIPLDLFGSCYNFETGEKLSATCVYPFGIDPIWYLAE
jgi:V-type H+-transporting ATPase subunit a